MNSEKSKTYIIEIFSSLQGEGGSLNGSCFGKRQIFVRFSGCNLYNNFENISSCFWCDSPSAQIFKNPIVRIEENPGSGKFKKRNNPIESHDLADIIKSLYTKDLHSISFTGGEPLCQLDFIESFLESFDDYKIEYPLYLETNGTIIPTNDQMQLIAKYFKYCCCDIKDRSSNIANNIEWHKIIDKELEFIEKFTEYNIRTFAKLIVTSKTKIEDIDLMCQRLANIEYNGKNNIGLAIQPVFLVDKNLKKKYTISTDHLNQIFYRVADYLSPNNISLSIQAHKYLNLL